MARWEVTLGQDSWKFVPEDLTMSSLTLIEEHLGCGLLEWLEQIDARRAHALQVLIWHLRGAGQGPTRKRDTQPIGACQGDTPEQVDFRLGDFNIQLVADTPLEEEDSDDSETPGSPPSSGNTD